MLIPLARKTIAAQLPALHVVAKTFIHLPRIRNSREWGGNDKVRVSSTWVYQVGL